MNYLVFPVPEILAAYKCRIMLTQRDQHLKIIGKISVFAEKIEEEGFVLFETADILHASPCNGFHDVLTQRINHLITHFLDVAELAGVRGFDDTEHIFALLHPAAPILVRHIKFQPFHRIISCDNLDILDLVALPKHILDRRGFVPVAEVIPEKVLDPSFECRHLAKMLPQQHISVRPVWANPYVDERLPVE